MIVAKEVDNKVDEFVAAFAKAGVVFTPEEIDIVFGTDTFVGISPNLIFFVITRIYDFVHHFNVYSYQIMWGIFSILCIAAIDYTAIHYAEMI